MRSLALVLAGCSFHSSTGPDDALGPIDAPRDAIVDTPVDQSVDGTPPSFVFEAEAFTSRDMPAAHQWTAETDVAGYSGASFMQCIPNNGAACTDLAALDSCAASIHYQLAIVEPGAYYFHVRMASFTTADDSIWYGLDGVPSPTAIDQMEDGTWKWETGASFVLAAGPHTLDIWQREGGARIDVVALTTTATPPP